MKGLKDKHRCGAFDGRPQDEAAPFWSRHGHDLWSVEIVSLMQLSEAPLCHSPRPSLTQRTWAAAVKQSDESSGYAYAATDALPSAAIHVA